MSYLLKEVGPEEWFEDGKIYGIPIEFVGRKCIIVNEWIKEDYVDDFRSINNLSVEDLTSKIVTINKRIFHLM